MKIESKILNPICIKLDRDSNLLMTDEKNYELGFDGMFNKEHYALDYNGVQSEVVNTTQNSIDVV